MDLKSNQIDIWQIQTSRYLPQLGKLSELLDEEQQARAARFHFEKDRQWYTIAHGLLRKILSQYVSLAPEKIEFEKGEHGKPYLKNHALQFNLSHSGDYILIAVGRDELGIDIEFHKENIETDALATRFFAEEEVAQLMQKPAEKQRQTFFDFWVCKEAFIKTIGMGLSFQLKNFAVDLTPPEKLMRIKNENLNEWQLKLLSAPENYSSAIVVNTKESFELNWREL